MERNNESRLAEELAIILFPLNDISTFTKRTSTWVCGLCGPRSDQVAMLLSLLRAYSSLRQNVISRTSQLVVWKSTNILLEKAREREREEFHKALILKSSVKVVF